MRAVFLGFSSIAFFLGFSCSAWAFPEMVRHGYVNCTACHVSPTGGGALTAYGRSLSREVLSTWGTEKEANFAYFVDTPPDWIIPGGDIRTVYTYRNTPALEEGKWIFMQGDLEAYGNYKDKFYAGGTVGVDRRQSGDHFVQKFISRRHYLDYRPQDTLSLRAGKFDKAYGINTPDHIIATKRGLGWDEGSETYNAEAAFLGESWNFFLTGVIGRPDDSTVISDKGVALTASYAFFERFKTGLSYFHGTKTTGVKRDLVGPWGILGFTHRFYLLTETDLQMVNDGNTPKSHGIVTYNKLGYELIQGLHAFFSEEFTNLSLDTNNGRAWGHTLGAEWFPRPHIDIELAWQKMLTQQFPNQYTDLAYAQLHFYF